MKRVAMIIVILAMANVLSAQQPGTQNPPAVQPGAGQSGTAQPGTPAPPAKHPPQAKTQPEFDAYKAVVSTIDLPAPGQPALTLSFAKTAHTVTRAGGSWVTDGVVPGIWLKFGGVGIDPGNVGPFKTATVTASTLTLLDPDSKMTDQTALKAATVQSNDPATFERAADDFATKFPDSELRVVLFRNGMHLYQGANNGDKMLDMGRKVLKIDPDDPEALVGVAEVLAERTRDTDLDKDQRLEEAMKNSQRAVETVDTDIVAPAGTPQEKLDAYKGFLRSTAYSIMGKLALDKDKYADAENYLRKSIDAYPSQPDPVAVLRLAVALDKQDKYPEALKVANQAVDLTQENTNAGTVARQERDRLMKLTNSGTPAPAPKPPAGDAQNQGSPKN